MALSTCTKCGNRTFEVKEAEPYGSNFKLFFVQCASCGGVVGVTEYYNVGSIAQKIANKLGVSL